MSGFGRLGASGFGGARGGFVPPSAPVFTGQTLGGFVDSTKTIASATGNRIAFGPGSTLLLIWHRQGAPATAQTIISSYSTTGFHGWEVMSHPSAGLTLTSDVTSKSTGASAIPSYGVIRAAIVWAVSGDVSVAVSGGPLISVGTLAAPTTTDAAAWASYIGTAPAELSGVRHALANDRILAVAVIPSVLTSAQASAVTYTTGDRYQYTASQRSGAVFDFLVSRDYASPSFASQGSSPVTFSVTGTPTVYRIGERRLALPFGDSAISEAHTDANGNALTVRSAHARGMLSTKAASVAVEADSNMQSAFAARAALGVIVGGAYSSQALAPQDSVPWIAEAQCGTEGTLRAVELWDGPTALRDNILTPTRHGTSVRAVRLPLYLADGNTSAGSVASAATRPSKTEVLWTDSIGIGFNTSPAAQYSPPAVMRAAGYRVVCMGSGGEAVYYRATVGGTPDATAAATWAAKLIAACNGTAANVVIIHVGTNDYGAGIDPTWTAARFGVAFGYMLDALIAAAAAAGVPGFSIKVITPIQRIAPSTESANVAGDPLSAYRTQETNACNARSITVIDGSAGAIVSNANMDTDGIHPTNAGAADLATAYESAAGAP